MSASREWRGDLAIVLASAIISGALAFYATGLLPAHAWTNGNDVWFEGDLATVTLNLTDRWSDQSRNANHPLFPLMTTPAVYAIHAAGPSRLTAVRIVLAIIAALWSAAMFVTLRLAGIRRLDATVFVAVAMTSASAMAWLTVPECVGLASVSVLAAFAVAGWSAKKPVATSADVLASAFSLSVTVTNWMAGLLMTFSRLPLKRALQVSANALCLTVLLWAVQRQLFQSADFFIGYSNYKRFLLRPEAGGPVDVARVLLAHGMVMPELGGRTDPKWGPVLSVQQSPIASGTRWALVASGSWFALLAVGVAGLRRAPRPLIVTVTGFLAWQLGLHTLFGEETFLYALHTLPALILLASFGTLTRARLVSLSLAGLLAVTAAMNNVHQLTSAVAFLDHRSSTPTSPPTNPPCLPTCYTPPSPLSGLR